jgi:nucleoside phosphorylase
MPAEVSVVCLNEIGIAATAAVGTQIIEFFRPRLIVMRGMCCGFALEKSSSRKKLLDVIVARDTSCWDDGTWPNIQLT